MLELHEIALYSGATGVGMAGAGLAWVIMRLGEAIYQKLTGRISLKRMLRREQKIKTNLTKYLLEISELPKKNREAAELLAACLGCGAVLAFIVPGFAAKIYAFFAGISSGTMVYFFISRYRRKELRLKKLKEAVLVYDTLGIYMDTLQNLPLALEKVLPALDALRTPIEKFLKAYPYGVREAVLALEKDMDFEEAGILASVMLQVSTTGALSDITSTEGVRMENIRKTAYRSDIAVRPYYRQVVLFIPLALAISLVLYVLGRHVLESLWSLNAGQYL